MKTSQVSEFKETEIRNLITTIIDHRGKTPKKLGGDWIYYGIPVISAKNIKNKKLSRFEEIRFITKEMSDKWMPIKLEKNDVLMTSEGATLGEVAILKQKKDYCIGQRLFAIRCNPKLLDPHYLYYYLISQKGQNEIFTKATGSTVEGLRQYEVENIVINLPSIEIQKKIRITLGILDDKIDNLQNQNKILEQIIQSIFKSWFVDFDGVTEFEDSELGKIPKGWKIEMLGDVAENIRDSINPKQITTNVKYIGLEHMPRERIFLDDWDNSSDSVMSNKFQFKKGDILFGKLRPYFRKVGISPISGICSTDILVINPKDPLWLGFVLCIVSSENFINFTDSASHGTRMPRTDWETMKNFQVIIPDLKSMKKHNHVFSPILNRAIINVHLIHDLMQIRDSLLPKLMSGEIRV